jgi:Na+/proline symporter
VFVALSLIIALSRVDVIVNLMVMSWGALAGVFMAPYLYGLFWKRATRAGAWAGIIAGLTSAFSLFLLWGKDGIPLAGAITMFLPMIVVPVVSLFTEAPPRELVERAFHDPQENTGTFDEKEYKKAAHG